MPLFDSFSKILATLSPHRPRHRQPDDRQRLQRRSSSQQNHFPTYSRELSPSPAERGHRTRNYQTPFSLVRRDDDEEEEEEEEEEEGDSRLDQTSFSPLRDTTALQQNTQSYAPTFDFPSGSILARGQVRSPTSQLVDSGDCSDDSSQMMRTSQNRNGRQSRPEESRQDEVRLLGGRFNDKNAVPIRPGESRKKRPPPGDSAAFKPSDNLSRNSRESGPVRAQGKSQSKALSSKNGSRLSEAQDTEKTSRPSKRMRNNEYAGLYDLTDDKSIQIPVQKSARNRLSPVSSLGSFKAERNTLPRQHEEFRGVEETTKIRRPHNQSKSPSRTRRRPISPEDSRDEKFTSFAAKQRRAGIEPIATSSNRDAIESAKSKSSRGPPSSRDSPDELQGDVTPKLVPGNVVLKPNKPAPDAKKEALLSPSRKRSPTDIRPTDFTSSALQGSKRSKRSHKPTSESFALTSLRFGDTKIPDPIKEPLIFHNEEGKIEFTTFNDASSEQMVITLGQINKAVQGDDSCRKVSLRLTNNYNLHKLQGQMVNIEFKQLSDKNKFVTLIRERNTKIQEKSSEFMDSSFVKYERELDDFNSTAKSPVIESTPAEPAQEPSTSSSSLTRRKITSALQGGDKKLPEDKSLSTKRDKSAAPPTQDDIAGREEKSKRPAESQKEREEGISIPVKKFQPKSEPERESRSGGRRSTRISDLFASRDDDGPSPKSTSKYPLKDDPFRKKWKQPLVYPQNGKKKAEVTVEDRDRLRDDEFLNDNLIAFYMRFLQDHLERTNSEAAKQVYFFNSYFYDTLTKTARGQHGINYSGVAKWTRNVDLFSYNYVVVPINQSAHWYVAIICNLPSLLGEAEEVEDKPAEEPVANPSNKKDLSNQSESEVHEILETPEPEEVPGAARVERNSESPASEATRSHLASMSLETDGEAETSKTQSKKQRQGEHQQEKGINQASGDHQQEEPTSADEWPVEDPRPSPAKLSSVSAAGTKAAEAAQEPASSSQPSASKKKGRPGQKLDPSQPTIITFDSLDLARSPTIRMLREYICEESVSKRGKEVDPKDIKGMRARQIPLQPNYSDCGLYLLAYLEKFVQDPDQFITKILQREMDEKDDWPPLGSGLLRQRLRDVLDQLYQEQEQTKRNKGEEKILADRQPVCHLLGPSSSEEEDASKPSREEPDKLDDASSKQEKNQKGPVDSGSSSSESDSDDNSTMDQLELVPTSTAAAVSNRKSSAPPATDSAPKPQPSKKKVEDIVEVPDSQESKQEPPTRSDHKPPRYGKKSHNNTEGSPKGQKPERKIGTDDEVLRLDESHSNKKSEKASRPRPQVEIQVRATPPSSPRKIRKINREAGQKP